MKKIKVLVFPAGTEIAFEIWNALKYSKNIELYGGTSLSCHAEFVFKNCINDMPYIEDRDFIDSLNLVIDKYGIEWIYPAHDSVVMLLAREREKVHAKIVSSDFQTVDICRSKNKTYEYFKDENFVPKTYKNIDEIPSYPIFIKPTVGQGANGARLVNTYNELKYILSDNIEYSICEYLPGNEYTVDCFTDFSGNLRVIKFRERERIRTGIAVRSRLLEENTYVRNIAECINHKLKFNGAWFFQIKKNRDGYFRLLEISPRIPGTMGISRNTGINFPLLTLYNMMGYNVEIIDNKNNLLMDRAFISRYKLNVEYDYVYLDYDDTLYIDGLVNIQLISFIYQAINQNKKIILITKHDGDIYDSLKSFKISSQLFYKIIHIDKHMEKADFITEKKSIFIDDSFSERKKIFEKLHIPVYDLDMVESLLDWRM